MGKKDIQYEGKGDTLAGRLTAGERSAAAELVDRYYGQLYMFFRRLGLSREVSEDLTQESFLQAWRHIGQLRSEKALNGWLYRIAGNLSRQYWRRYKGGESVGIESAYEAGAAEEGGGSEAEHREQLGRLRQSVSRLPMKLREAIVLHYMQHLTIVEAAEAAGVREGTFKSRLSRALEKLRGNL